MKLRLYNAKILTAPGEEIINGEVRTDGDTIVGIGAADPSFVAEREINCFGDLLMSGFCNAHTHAAMCLFRGIADDLSLEDWLYERIFPLEKNLTPDDIYWGTMLQIAEYVRNGITCFADMYFSPDAVYAAANNAHLCLALCCGENSSASFDVVRFIEENYNKYSTLSDRVRYYPGVHAEYTCSEKLLTEVADFAIEVGAKTYIHLSETLKEVGDCTVRHGGLTPPQYLHKLGFFENGGLAAHCVYCDKDDIALLRQSGVTPVINSGSNLKLASGIAPVYSMLTAGLRPSLGTDGAASNNATSMFREMYLYSCLQKQAMKDASVVTAEEALSAATENGYQALGFRGGAIRKGNFADLIRIDLRAPSMQPLANINKNLVYSAGDANVHMTISGGKIVYEDGVFHIGESIEKIVSECKRRQGHLLSEAGLSG